MLSKNNATVNRLLLTSGNVGPLCFLLSSAFFALHPFASATLHERGIQFCTTFAHHFLVSKRDKEKGLRETDLFWRLWALVTRLSNRTLKHLTGGEFFLYTCISR